MRKTIDFLGWVSVVLTILAVICTMLTTYNLGYVEPFDDYRLFQISLFFTMSIWALKLYGADTGKRKWANSAVFLLFALVALYYVFSYVK